MPSTHNFTLTLPEKIALAVCTALHLLPVWLFTYFPTQDGPTHLENAMILTQYYGADGGLWHHYYAINNLFTPTWLNHLALAGLVRLVPPLIAEKLFVTGYLVGMIAAFYYCLRAFSRSAGFCVALIFPFLFNYLVHMGFYSFSYSLIVYLVVIGYYWRHRAAFNTARTAAFFLLSLLLYLLHPISLVMAVVFVGPLVLLDALIIIRSAEQNPGRKAAVIARRALPALAMLCVIILVAAFAKGQPRGGFSVPDILTRAGQLFCFTCLATFDRKEFIPTVLFGLMFALLLFRGGRRLFARANPYRSLMPVLALYVLMYLVLPNWLFGGGWVVVRLALFAILLFMVWAGANHRLWRLRAGIQAGAYLVALVLLAMHVPKYAQLNDYLREYVSASGHITPGTTLLPVSFSHWGRTPEGTDVIMTRKVLPFLHCSGYIAVERRVVEFSNYEPARAYFPLVYRNNLNPYVHIGNLEGDPPVIRSFDFPEGSGGRIDYVLVWGRKVASDHEDEIGPLMKRIGERYELLFRSQPRGLAEVWRNKDFSKHYPQ